MISSVHELIHDPRYPLPVVPDDSQIGWTGLEILNMTRMAKKGDTIFRRVGLSMEDTEARPLTWKGLDLISLVNLGDMLLDDYAEQCSRHPGEVKVVEHQFALARRWPVEHGYTMHPLLHELEGGMALVAAVKVIKHAHRLGAAATQEIADGLYDYRQSNPEFSIRDISAAHFIQKDYGRRKYLVDIDLPMVYSGNPDGND